MAKKKIIQAALRAAEEEKKKEKKTSEKKTSNEASALAKAAAGIKAGQTGTVAGVKAATLAPAASALKAAKKTASAKTTAAKANTPAAEPTAVKNSVKNTLPTTYTPASPYAQAVQNYLKQGAAFAAQGPKTKQALANSLLGMDIYDLARGDVSHLNWDALVEAQIRNEIYKEEYRKQGLFNSPEFLSGQYITLPSDDYISKAQADTLTALEESRAKDEKDKLFQSNLQSTRGAWEQLEAEKNNPYMFDPMYGYAMMEYLQGDRAEPFNYDQWEYEYQMLDPTQQQIRLSDLEKQWAALDFDALTGREYKYESQTLALEEKAKVIEREMTRRSTEAELAALAYANPEFEALSVYNDTYTAPEKGTFKYIFGNDAFVNGLDNPARFINADSSWAEKNIAAEYSAKVKSYLDNGYQYMTPQQIAVYNVLYNTDQDKAQEYLDAIRPVLLASRAAVNQEYVETLSTNPWLAGPMAVASVGAGLATPFQLIPQAYEALTGKDDLNSSATDLSRFQQDVRVSQEDWIGEAGGPSLFGKTLWQHLYSGGMGAIDNAARIGFYGPTSSLWAAGAQSASGSLQENAARDDMSGAAKIVQALLTGGAEIGTEKIGLDALFDKGQKNAFNYIKGVIASELGEETLNYLSDDVIDAAVSFVFDHEADIKSAPEFWQGLGETAITTLISSALMGGGGAITQTVDNRQTGKAVQNQGDPEAMLEIGKAMPKDSEAYAIAVDIEGTVGKGKKMPLGQLGRLTQAIGQKLSEEYKGTVDRVMEDAITERLVELGTDSSKARKNASVIRKLTQGEKLTAAERAAVAWDDNATQVTQEIGREITQGKVKVEGAAPAEPEGLRTGQKWVTDMRIRQVEGTGEYTDLGKRYRQAMERPVTKAAKEAAKAGEEKVNRGKNGKPTGKMTAKKVYFDDGTSKGEGDILRFEKAEDGLKMVVQTGKTDKETATVSLDAMTSSDGAGTAGLISYLEDTGIHTHDISAEEANTMLAAYNVSGGDVGRFIDDYTTAYLEGYTGIEGSETGIGKEIANVARANGQKEAAEDEKQRKQRASDYKAVENPVAGWLGRVDSNAQVKGQGDVEGLEGALEELTEEQRITAETAIGFGKAVGLNVVLFESNPENIQDIQNGSFDEITHTVYLDVNSGTGSAQDVANQKKNHTLGYAMGRTLSHELTHYLEAAAPEAYAKYTQAVKAALKTKGQDFAVLMREKMDRAIQNGYKLTMQGAAAEVIADASEYMLQDSKFTNNLDTTVKGKIKAFIQNFAQKVKDIFRNLTGGHKESAALREMKDGVYHYMEGLQDLWDAGFVEILDKGTDDLSVGATEMVEDGLMATHNLTEDKLRKALSLGSFPMPSIAIHKATNNGNSVYGDYTVVFGRETIDPDVSKDNKVYVNDAYTAPFPQAYVESNPDASANEIVEVMKQVPESGIPKYESLKDVKDNQGELKGGRYFEAKPERVVGFDEIKMVIAPNTIPEDLVAAFDERGIPYTTYDGNEADRLRKLNLVPDVKFSMRDVDVSYDALVNKEDMHLTMLTDNIGTRDRVAIINAGYENAKSRGTEGKSGMPAIYVKDIERNVHISKNSLKHGLDRRADAMSTAVQHAGELLENAILINTAAPKKAEATDSYILLSAGKESDGTIIMVEFVVNSFTDEVESFDVMYSMKTKWNQPRQNAELGGKPLRSPDSTISIADLLDYGKDYFSDVLSEDVLNHFGTERKETEITQYLRYSDRDLPDGITIRDYLRDLKPTSRMNETEKYLLKKYQEQQKVLEEKEQLVAQQEEIIRTAPFRNPDGSLNDEITKAKNRYKIYRDQANRAARALTAYERDDGFASILATGRQVVNELQMGSAGGIADAADVLEKDVAELTAKLTKLEADVTRTASGQRIAFARGLYKPDDLKAAAQQLKDTYGSRMSVNNIADRLALTFGELYANDGAEGAKMFSAAAKDLAVDLLRGNKFRYKSEILPMLREKIGSISLSETDVQEIENRGYTLREFRSMLSPYIKVTEGASDLSSYATNAQYYGEGALAAVLNDDTEGNLAMRLYEVISQEKAKEAEIAYEGMTENQLIGMAMADIAGANLPMSANNQTVEYLRKELMKYAGENATVAIAVEEAIGKAKTTTAKAGNVWREAVKHTETARQAVEYYRKLEEQRRVLELAEQKKSLTEQLRSDNAQKLKEKVDKQRQEYRAREQKAREYRKTRDEVDKLRKGIGRKVKRLNTLRVRETDQKHVPQELQHVADLVMSTFTGSELGRLAFHEAKLLNLGRTYRLLMQSESDAAYFWDDEIEADIENLKSLSEAYTAMQERGSEYPSRFSLEGVELETEILQGVDAIVSNVLSMIDSTNRAFLYKRSETFDQFANKTGEKLRKHDDYKVRKGWRGKVQTMLDESIRTGNMTPVYFFDHLHNQELLDVFNEIRDGMHKAAMIEREGKEYIEKVRDNRNYGKWVADGNLKMKTGNGHIIELTREEACEIYAIAKREQANKLYQTEHLLSGGFQYKHRDQHVSDDRKYLVQDVPNKLDAADLEKIGNWLTAEQKAYADDLVGFLSTTMADYGNEASMDMYGYKKFTESYYIPFHTVANQRFQKGDEGPQGENAGTGRVKNSGFTHKVQHKANQPLYVGGLTETVADHIHRMAAYSAMVQPIENMKRLLNHKVLESDGTVNTIRALIGQKYGKASEDYMTQLLKDLNGATQSDQRAAALTDKLVGAFKRGAVMASASVVLQQPTAMARAMAMVSPKYFAQNPFYRPGKGTWDEMLKHSGTAVIKDMGKFDVGMGLTASQYILDENLSVMEAYQRLKGESKTKAGKAAYDRFMAWLTAAPGAADQWTWGMIWKAVKAEQADLHPGMDVSSDAFLNLVGERFDDVVDHTQVYDSVMSRSNLMRSTNALHKMATSFMSEPTLSLNMLYDALTGIKSKRHTGWHRGRIIGSVVASQVLAGALAALVQAWNDDDDKRSALEKYADRATGNILDNLNPLGMIPYVSDIVSLFEGYDVERPDMSVIADVYSYGKTFFKSFENGGKPTWKQIENFAGTLANLTGVPAKNISREIRRTWNAVFNTDWSAPSAFSVGQAMKENLIWYSDKKTEYYDRIVTAKLRGDEQESEDLRAYMLASKGADEDDLTEGIRNAYKARYEEGGIEKDDAITFLLENELVKGDTEDKRKQSAFQYVDRWEEGTTDYSAYNTLKDAYGKIDYTAISKAWKELTNYGYTDEQVKEESRKLLRKLVEAGTITPSQATQILRKWCSYKKDSDNVSKPQEWLKSK